MTDHTFKVGDIVRKRVEDGYEMRVDGLPSQSLVGFVTKEGRFSEHNRMRYVVGERGGAVFSTFELVSPNTLEAQLAAAQAEVKRLEAEVRQASAPKVGDWMLCKSDNSRGKVVFINDRHWVIELIGGFIATPGSDTTKWVKDAKGA